MYEKKIDQDDSYLESRLRPLGITPRLRSFPLNEYGGSKSYFSSDSRGNLVMLYPAADGGCQEYWRQTKAGTNAEDLTATVIERVRFRPGQEPVDKKTGKLQRYRTPSGCPTPLFIPRNTLQRIRDLVKTPVLFVVEGELKAAAADRHGLPIVAVAGIQNTGTGKQRNPDDLFLAQLRKVIDKLQVERLVFMYDSDLLDLGGSAEAGGDPTTRPRNFYGSAKVFAQRAQSMGLQAFIAWPEAVDSDGKRGLDDEILTRIGEPPVQLHGLEDGTGGAWSLATPLLRRLATGLNWTSGTLSLSLDLLELGAGPSLLDGRADLVSVRDHGKALSWIAHGRREMRRLLSLPVGKGRSDHGWRCLRIDGLADIYLREIWALHSPEAFLDRHRATMGAWESFLWGSLDGKSKRLYRIVNGEAVEDGLEIEIKLEARDGITYAMNNDGARRRLGKFTMQGRWRLVGARTGYVLDIQHFSGRREWKMLPSEAIASSDRFRVLMLDMGMVWKGRQDELNEILETSIVDAETAEVAGAIGWDQDLQRWVWANGIYEPGSGFSVADEEGAVRPGGQAMLLPCAPMFKSEDEFKEARLLPFEPGDTTWGDWYLQAMKVYGTRRAAVAAAYVAAACCLDIIRSKRRFFPILFAFGPKGQGKSTYMRSIQAFFGKPVKPVNMETGTTVAGLQRKLAAFRQVPVFLDECSARTRPELVDVLKNFYDGTGGTQAVRTGSNQTKSFEARAAAIAASQHLPSHDPALVSRCVLVEFPERAAPTIAQKKLMTSLQAIEESGLQHLVHRVVDLRPKVEREWPAAFMRAYEEILEWAAKTGTPIDDRTAEIHAAMATPLLVIGQDLFKDLEWGLIIDAFQSLLPLHADASSATDEIEFFWSVFERMAKSSPPRVVHGVHYTVNHADNELSLQLRQVHLAYKGELKILGEEKSALPEGTLRRYLTGSKAFVEKRKARLTSNGQVSSLVVFALDKAPVSID